MCAATSVSVGLFGYYGQFNFGDDLMALLFAQAIRRCDTECIVYTLWRNNLGATVAPFSSADRDGNGVIDFADYSVWKTNFGATSGQPSAGSSTLSASSATVEHSLPAAFDSAVATVDAPEVEAAFAVYESPAWKIASHRRTIATQALQESARNHSLLLLISCHATKSDNTNGVAAIALGDTPSPPTISASLESSLATVINEWP